LFNIPVHFALKKTRVHSFTEFKIQDPGHQTLTILHHGGSKVKTESSYNAYLLASAIGGEDWESTASGAATSSPGRPEHLQIEPSFSGIRILKKKRHELCYRN
jgi:hypothetical protein